MMKAAVWGICPEVGDMALERILKRSRFSARLSAPHIEMLGALGRKVRFEEDQLILQAGQKATHFYLVVSGSVCVEVRTPVYTVCVQVLGPGDAFGWSSFLNQHDSLFQVRAREASRVICWDALPLFSACRENPGFGLDLYSAVLELVAGRVKATESKLAEFCGSVR
jgi:CRP-like cAMP-binding protein